VQRDMMIQALAQAGPQQAGREGTEVVARSVGMAVASPPIPGRRANLLVRRNAPRDAEMCERAEVIQ
jgi:hypothetical protein